MLHTRIMTTLAGLEVDGLCVCVMGSGAGECKHIFFLKNFSISFRFRR